ncbi:CPBP family intramembrane glutamic endopeptidase [Schlesneria paludicola]|uniref:CPBP family intramembrane glutamic endopeptidase n=1 Tax=Schlesneria paludicola TaxID=360056 RepID=UPI00029A7A1F|nr:type II CAAX endopeptidase family protein [Schlesneria paludicola]
MFATSCLFSALILASAFAWQTIIRRRIDCRPILEWNEEPRATWRSIPEMLVVYVALLWPVSHLFVLSLSPPIPSPITLDAVARGAAVNFCLILAAIGILASSHRPLAEFGMSFRQLSVQARVALFGFCAAVLPMAVSMLATLPLRGRETQHSLLKLLTEQPDVTTIGIIAMTAVISAPLWEELMFRVVLQGWLTSMFTPKLAIPIVAALFSFIHGWQNGLALLPLALILGYVFHRRHSYLSVVMIHALFNATMLTAQLLNPQIP